MLLRNLISYIDFSSLIFKRYLSSTCVIYFVYNFPVIGGTAQISKDPLWERFFGSVLQFVILAQIWELSGSFTVLIIEINWFSITVSYALKTYSEIEELTLTYLALLCSELMRWVPLLLFLIVITVTWYVPYMFCLKQGNTFLFLLPIPEIALECRPNR